MPMCYISLSSSHGGICTSSIFETQRYQQPGDLVFVIGLWTNGWPSQVGLLSPLFAYSALKTLRTQDLGLRRHVHLRRSDLTRGASQEVFCSRIHEVQGHEEYNKIILSYLEKGELPKRVMRKNQNVWRPCSCD